MRNLILAALIALATAAPALAAERNPQTAALTPADREVVAQVEQTLNGIKTMKSHFLQVSSNGAQAEGELYISRPGKLRINYAPPTPMQLLVEGSYLIQVDTKLGTLTYIPLSRTPAGILIRSDIKLDGDITVTGIRRGQGVVRVGMVQRGKEDEGELTMVFTESPFALRQWSVMDAQGVETQVTLMNPEVNVALDPHVFDFDARKYDSNRME